MSGPSVYDLAEHDSAIIHASCVAVAGQALLIVGASGSGKSALALQMMALGADLVADDRVELRAEGAQVLADAAPNIRGMIEARGIGILRASAVGLVPLACVVDLDQQEQKRFPEANVIRALRQSVPLFRGLGVPNLAAALMQLMKMGRVGSEWSGK